MARSSFTYYDVSDTATSNVATVYITVNSFPVAEDDHYAAAENQELDVAAADGVLANDFNADGNPLTAVLNTPPANGAVTLHNDGSFSYVPDSGFTGTDSFTYYAVNGPAVNDLLCGESYESLATVYITVYSIPVANDDDYQLISNPDGLVVDAAHGVLANDSNPDGSPLTAVLHTKPRRRPAAGVQPRWVLHLLDASRLLWHGQLHLL